MKKDTIAIIPARKNSQRLKNKNLKSFFGKPLIYYSICEAKKSKFISEVIVSTDSKSIANKSIKYGAKVPFLRSKILSGHKVETVDVIKDLYNRYIFKDKYIKRIIVLQPTSPLRDHKDIDNSLIFYKSKKADLIMSVCEAKPKSWFYELNEKKKINLNKKKSIKPYKNYLLNGAIYIYNINLFKKKNITPKKVFGFVMAKKKFVDIDDEIDFNIAALMKNFRSS